MKKIFEETKLAEFLKDPAAMKILAKFKVPCLVCPFAQSEMDELKIGDVCKMYKIDSKKLLAELNKLYQE